MILFTVLVRVAFPFFCKNNNNINSGICVIVLVLFPSPLAGFSIRCRSRRLRCHRHSHRNFCFACLQYHADWICIGPIMCKHVCSPSYLPQRFHYLHSSLWFLYISWVLLSFPKSMQTYFNDTIKLTLDAGTKHFQSNLIILTDSSKTCNQNIERKTILFLINHYDLFLKAIMKLISKIMKICVSRNNINKRTLLSYPKTKMLMCPYNGIWRETDNVISFQKSHLASLAYQMWAQQVKSMSFRIYYVNSYRTQ